MQSFVASVGWIAVLWLIQALLGDPLKSLGLFQGDVQELKAKAVWLALVLLGVEFFPFVFGVSLGILFRYLDQYGPFGDSLRWTGLFEVPSAWDQAWAQAALRNRPAGWVEVSVRLKGGDVVEGRYGADSRADLCPRQNRYLYLETGMASTIRKKDDCWAMVRSEEWLLMQLRSRRSTSSPKYLGTVILGAPAERLELPPDLAVQADDRTRAGDRRDAAQSEIRGYDDFGDVGLGDEFPSTPPFRHSWDDDEESLMARASNVEAG